MLRRCIVKLRGWLVMYHDLECVIKERVVVLIEVRLDETVPFNCRTQNDSSQRHCANRHGESFQVAESSVGGNGVDHRLTSIF